MWERFNITVSIWYRLVLIHLVFSPFFNISFVRLQMILLLEAAPSLKSIQHALCTCTVRTGIRAIAFDYVCNFWICYKANNHMIPIRVRDSDTSFYSDSKHTFNFCRNLNVEWSDEDETCDTVSFLLLFIFYIVFRRKFVYSYCWHNCCWI